MLNSSVTTETLLGSKRDKNKIVALTAYDYCSAYLAVTSGVEVLLVGDSLGMVIQGHKNSLSVSVDDIVYHLKCVVRANTSGSLVMADLPFMSYYSKNESLKNAATLIKSGAHMVKLEGGKWLADSTSLLAERGIPVCAHIGLMPQSINSLGGYHVQGRDPVRSDEIIAEALVLEQAGASAVLVECVPSSLGEKITKTLKIPVIGIGAGPKTDGQIIVWHDVLGLYPHAKPKFVKNFLHESGGSVQDALLMYVNAVKSGDFPGKEHCYN